MKNFGTFAIKFREIVGKIKKDFEKILNSSKKKIEKYFWENTKVVPKPCSRYELAAPYVGLIKYLVMYVE